MTGPQVVRARVLGFLFVIPAWRRFGPLVLEHADLSALRMEVDEGGRRSFVWAKPEGS